MPTYAYACKSCGHAFDAVQAFSDASLTDCPECGGTLRKKFGSIGITFNGSGFYRTDSRGTETATQSASSAVSTASSASSTSTATESQPAPSNSGGSSAA